MHPMTSPRSTDPVCNRRQFLAAGSTAAIGLAAAGPSRVDSPLPPRHILTLLWDDGFRVSSVRTAEIFEEFGLSASFNVIATGGWRSFVAPDPYQEDIVKGDFGLWNDLQARGHEIMPHGYKHALLPDLPLKEGQFLLRHCFDIFVRELEGFQMSQAIFHFPYNSATPELEDWLLPRVRAYRTSGGGYQPLPREGQRNITCGYFGPGSCEDDLQKQIANLLARDSGWLVYNLHGLDDEGWGPVRATYLEDLLTSLTRIPSLAILPPGAAMDLMDSLRP
jgi:peptidoglycan/xylan/chitin deacetylase (PgdA/CDA1 family)